MTQKKKIAIIGTGVSGLTCGYLLGQKHSVTLYEANDYIGGHTATVAVEVDGKTIKVDTGFIVFNDKTYPNFLKLMGQIGIERKPTRMSFSVQNATTGLEYNGKNLNTLFAQRSNLLNLKFIGFIKAILRFNDLAKKAYADGDYRSDESLGEFLDRHSFNEYFSINYILPMVAAIWSSSISDCRDFPLKFFLQFFINHGLLEVKNRPQWYVVKGGSNAYVPHLLKPVTDIHLSCPVKTITRKGKVVEVTTATGSQTFDEVILACHSDQALKLLADPTQAEREVLGSIVYRENEVILHTDRSLLPKSELAIAAWNYVVTEDQSVLPRVTYDMNILQGLPVKTKVCVTLNQTQDINPDLILGHYKYHHPVYTQQTIDAQARRDEICGIEGVHYCGAYWYNGFHEDGVRSALDVCQRLGCQL